METYIETLKELSTLEEIKLDITNEMPDEEKIKVIYNFLKCKNFIQIGELQKTYFHIYFDNENEMIHYSIFIKLLIDKLNMNLKKTLFYCVIDAGICDISSYTTRIDMN